MSITIETVGDVLLRTKHNSIGVQAVEVIGTMLFLGWTPPDQLAARDNATADAALDRATRAAHGEVLSANESGKIIFRSDGHNEWTPEGDYGMGRSDATAAILALKSTTQTQRDAMAKISSEEKRLKLE